MAQRSEPAVQLRRRRPKEPSGVQVCRGPARPRWRRLAKQLVVRSLKPTNQCEVALLQEASDVDDASERGHGALAELLRKRYTCWSPSHAAAAIAAMRFALGAVQAVSRSLHKGEYWSISLKVAGPLVVFCR